MPNACSTSLLLAGAASAGQADRSGSRFSLTLPSVATPRSAAPAGETGASLAHALARAAITTTNELPNHLDTVLVINILLVCGARRL
jgi:hypothetical protein